MTRCLATLHQSRQQAPNITVCSGISHHRSFKTCPHFPRTAHRHCSSIQIRAAYSITARSASQGMPLTRCSVDLLHLDQFSSTLSNVGGTPRPFHASNYLGLTQVLNLERRICRLCHALNHCLLSQPLILFGQSSEFLQQDLHLLPQSVLQPST